MEYGVANLVESNLKEKQMYSCYDQRGQKRNFPFF